ncbi:DASH family cryptochrome [Alcanivorax hongdengensis]|uniref:DASH family cryptochrome n=1 Tax=Alcanivorax hongdengensis TaxID=519051 RepID=UPI0002E365B9|nr:DASH family cryptochrome [Alcanivorax hongdengensis]
MITVIWFRQDLRVQDQPLLRRAAALGAPVLTLYVLPERWLAAGEEGFDRLGPAKSCFLLESVQALADGLNALGLTLVTACGGPASLLAHWQAQAPLQVVTAEADAPEEQAGLAALRRAGIPVHEVASRTLLCGDTRPGASSLCGSFSRFRRRVEADGGPPVAQPEGPPPALAAAAPLPLPAGTESALAPLQQRCRHWLRNHRDYFSLPGGEPVARRWLEQYLFSDRHIAHYNATRNQLIGSGFSSRLSAALAWGCLSVRRVWHAILEYERRHGASEHSYWLRFELLWREFFHWSLREHGTAVFRYQGLSPSPDFPPLEEACHQGYWQRWCQARTGLPFIDANLRELMATGYLSNRGRQNLASFFVHDMGLDWRRGARWFEHHLVDHDVASNWGNWAYIAGKGHDARGGRRFSPTRQWWRHDPHAAHLHHWLPPLRRLTPEQCLALHFSAGQPDPLADYPAAMLALPAADRVTP